MPMPPSRRSFLAGVAAVAAVSCARPNAGGVGDGLVVGAGLRWQSLLAFCDIVTPTGDRFGSDADFLATFPLDTNRFLLWVNHEFPPIDAGVMRLWTGDRAPTPADVSQLMGGSVVEIARGADGVWAPDPGSKRNFRVHGGTPGIVVTGPGVEVLGPVTTGTLSNCGGGVTPWGTVLTCEENHRYHVSDVRGVRTGKFPPGTTFDSARKPAWFNLERAGEGFGWVVEVDPRDGTFVRRHTALGRFRHECAAVHALPDAQVRVFMAEDRDLGCLWRYTSRGVWRPAVGRENSSLLADGLLEVARLSASGGVEWIPVGRTTPVRADRTAALFDALAAEGEAVDPTFREAARVATTLGDIYSSEAAILVDASLAGLLAGGTGLGRPEGCVVDGEGRPYFAVTKGLSRPSPQGSPFVTPGALDHADGFVVRMVEGATRWEVVARGGEGPQPFGRPDNLGFDRDGAVIVATDIDDGSERDLIEKVDNNGVFRLGERAARLVRAPDGAEVCSPIVMPDGAGILCSIQHPDPGWNQGRSTVGIVLPA